MKTLYRELQRHTVDYDINKMLDLYRKDPADSDYQRGFLAALLQVFNINDQELENQMRHPVEECEVRVSANAKEEC